jgi:hypothetical protein
MFERLKDCADRINDQLGPAERPLPADALTAIGLLASTTAFEIPERAGGNCCRNFKFAALVFSAKEPE